MRKLAVRASASAGEASEPVRRLFEQRVGSRPASQESGSRLVVQGAFAPA